VWHGPADCLSKALMGPESLCLKTAKIIFVISIFVMFLSEKKKTIIIIVNILKKRYIYIDAKLGY